MKTATSAATRNSFSFLTVMLTVGLLSGLAAPSAHATVYYWDNVAGAGFGTAGGTWSTTTAGPVPGWGTDPAGTTAAGSVTTGTADDLNFGTATVGLATGSITAGTVSALSLTFGSASGAVTIASGTITLGAAATVTVNNAADTVSSILAGAATSLTKAGTGTLTLSGINTYAGQTIVSAGILRATTSASALGAGTLSLGAATLQLANDTGLSFGRNTTVTNSSAIITSDRLTSGAGVTHTLGTLSIGAFTLTTNAGGNATGTTAGITFGATTLTGNATVSPATNTTLSLAAITGAFTLTMNGAGNLILTSTVNPSAGLIISNGTVTINTNNSTAQAPLTVNSPGALNFSNGQIFGVLNGSGTITENTNWLYTNSSTSGTFSGVIAGTGGYIKQGTGTETLSGLNTYTGSGIGTAIATQINGGSLSINTLKTVGGGSSSLGAPTTAALGIISMGNTTTTGTLIYTGALTSTDRQIQIGTNTTGTPVVGDTGGATIQNDGTGPLTFSATNFNSPTNAATGTSPTRVLTLQGTNTGANTISGIIQNNQIAAASTAAVSITKAQAGTWVLSGVNTYTGVTTVSGGILRATTSAQALGTGAATLSLGAGTLQLANDTGLNFARNTTVTAGTTITSDRLTSGAGVTHNLGTLSIGAFTLSTNSGGNATGTTAGITFGNVTQTGAAVFDVASGNTLTLGALQTTAQNITKQNSGTLILGTAANAARIAGTNTLTAGTMRLGSASALGTAVTTLVLNGGNLDLAVDTTVNAHPTTVGGTVTINSNRATSGAGITHTLGTLAISAQTLSVTQGSNATGTTAGVTFGATTLSGNATFSPDTNTTLTLAAVSGAFGMTKTGAGTLTITGIIGTGTGTLTVNNGTVNLNNSGNTFTGAVNIDGTGVIVSAGQNGTAGDPNYLGGGSKAINLTNGGTYRLTSNSNPTSTNTKMFTFGTGGGVFDINSGVTLTLDDNTGATAQLQGSGNMTKTGLGNLALGYTGQVAGGFSGYTGNIIVNAGGLIVGNADALGSLGGTTTINSGAALSVATNASNPLVVAENLTLSGTGVSSTGALLNNQAIPATFSGTVTLGADTSVGGTGLGGLTLSGNIGGAFKLTKVGSGRLTLGGANTYSGGTVVNEGSLFLTGSIPTSTALTVNPTVAGGAAFSLSSGAANPLTNVSLLTVGSATGPTVLGFDVGTTSDSIITPNPAVMIGTININITPITGFGVGTYTLLTAPGGLTSGGASYVLASAPGGYTYSLTALDTSVTLNVLSAATGTGNLYWRGDLSGSWGASGSGSNTNWYTDVAGTTNAQYSPFVGNTVIFSTTNATGPTISTTLDNNFTVNNLLFSSNPSAVTAVSIAPFLAPAQVPGILTITPASSADGIGLAQNAGNVTISAPVVLGSNQTWSIDASGATPTSLTLSGGITAASTQSLTLLATAGSPNVTLSGNGLSTYTGSTTVGAGVTLTNGTTSSLPGLSPVTLEGTLATGAFAGTIGSLSGVAGVVQNGSATNATLTLGDDNTNQSFSGTIQNGSTGLLLLTKRGTGSQTLSGTNTHSGNTLVSAGVLNITGTGSITGNTTATKLLLQPTVSGTSAVVNYSSSATSTFFAVNGANVAGTASVFNQSNGFIQISPNASTDTQSVVTATGAYGVYNISGGTFRDSTGTTGGSRFTVTNQGTASATNGTITGVRVGIVNVSGTGFIDHTNAEWWLNYSLGQITVTDSGKIDHTGSNNPFGLVLNPPANNVGGGYGVLNIAGTGAQVITGAQSLRMGNSTTANNGDGLSAFVNLAAGTLSTGTIATTSLPAAPTATNYFYYNYAGGTLMASNTLATGWTPATATQATFINTIFGPINNSAVTGAPSFNGGLTVDTNGNAVTIPPAQPLLGASGFGVTQGNLSVSGGSGYIGAPSVTFSRPLAPTGVAAAGYALMSGGSVAGIVITDPGVYALNEVPTIILLGGFATGAGTAATASCSALGTANTSGGLTKVGVGTLTLSGAVNTYTGGTTVTGGTLALGINGALASTGNVTVNGGIFDLATFTNTVGVVSLQSGTIQGSTGVLTSTATYDVQSGNITFSNTGGLAGNVGLTKTTGGTVTLSNGATGNVFTGAVNVNGGTLAFSAGNQLGNGSLVTNTLGVNGGTLSYTGTNTTTLTANQVLTLGSSGGTLNASDAGGVLNLTGGISAAAAPSLTKTGPGTIAVTGSIALSGSGSATVSDGKLVVGFGTNGVSQLTVGSTGNMDFSNGVIEILTLGTGAGALTLNNGARLGFELNGSASDSLTVPAGGTVNFTGAFTIDLTAVGAGVTNNLYTLITAPAGSLLNSYTYILGNAPPGFNYSFMTSDTMVQLQATPYTPIYWKGLADSSWFTATNGANFNWSVMADGSTDSATVPNSSQTAIFSAMNAAGAPTLVTSLDANFTLDSLQFINAPTTPATTSVTINQGTLGTLTLSPSSSSGGIYAATNSGSALISAPLVVAAQQTWKVDATGTSLEVGGGVTFTSGVSKNGAGSLKLSSSNSGAGSFTLSAGSAIINANNVFGTGTFTLAPGTTIDAIGAARTLNNSAYVWNGGFTHTGSQNLDLGSSAVALGVSLTATVSANTLTVGGIISDGGNARSLTKAGAGTLTLSGANTYSGGTILTAGTLNLSGNNTFGAGSVIVNGGTATLSGSNAYTGGTAVNGGSLLLSGSNSFGTGGITVSGGTATISGSNTFTGGTILNSGTLNLGNAGALGSGSLTITGGTLDNSSGSALALTTNNAQAWNGNFTFTGTNSLDLGTGAVAISSTRTVTVSANTLTVGGIISGSGFGLVKTGAGTLTLGGSNSYTGTTTISTGVLRITNGSALGSTSAGTAQSGTSALELDGSGGAVIVGNEALSINGGGITNFGALRNIAGNNTYGGTVTMAAQSRINSDSGTLTLSNATSVSGAFILVSGGAGNTTISGAVGVGAGGISKDGTGVLTLSGASTYTGNTTISAGTLNITGSVTGNTTASTLAYGGTAGNIVVNHSGSLTAFVITGANVLGAVSVFNQTAGTVTIIPTNGADTQFLANNGGYGMLNITGGTFNTGRFDGVGAAGTASSAAVIYVGGTGTLNQNVGDWVLPIRANGMMEMTIAPGGTFTRQSAVTAQFSIIGLTGAGTYGIFNVAGGTVDTGTKGLNIGQSGFSPGAGNVGFVNAAGGTLSLGLNVAVGAAAGSTNAFFNFAGATVKSTAAMTAVIPASTANYTITSTVFGPITNNNSANAAFNTQIGTTSNFTGGLTVDTNNFATTFSNALLAASGFGVTQANITIPATGNSGYIGAPMVQFSAPAAVGADPASGYAVISGGAVSGIVITNPGVYALNETPTITLTGGGGTIAAFPTGALTTANVSGGLTKTGLGTLTLTGTNTYSGATTIANGILNANTSAAIGDGSATNTLVFTGGTLQAAAAITSPATRPVTLTSTGIIDTNTFAVSIAGAISGPSGLNKISTGTLTLSGNNSYVGDTTISGGVIDAANANALGSGTVSIAGGIRLLVDTGISIANPIIIGANAGASGNGLVQAGTVAGTATVSGPITINNGAAAGGHFAAPTAGTVLNVNGVITASVPVVHRTGVVSYSGGGTGYTVFTDAQGTAKIGANNGIATTATASIGTSAAAFLDLNGFNQTLVGIAKGGSAATIGNSSTTADSILTTTGTALTYAGLIVDVISPGTRKVGLTVASGDLTLTGANTYTGGTTLNQGTLTVGAGGTIGGIGALSVNNTNSTAAGNDSILNLSTTLDTAVGSLSGTIATPTSGTNTATINTGGVGRNFTVNQTTAGSYAGVIAGAGSFTLGGSDSLTLAGANTFTGGVTINAGTLQLGNVNALNSTVGSENSVTFGADALSTATLNLNGNSVVVGNLTTNATPGTPIVQNANATPATLTVGNSLNLGGTFASVIQDGTGGGALSLTKAGTATYILTGTNTYTGLTVINAGTLQIGSGSTTGTLGSGNVTNNGALTFNRSDAFSVSNNISGNGAVTQLGSGTTTLTGTNSYTGVTTVSAGTLALGNGSALGDTAVTVNNGTLQVNGSATIGATAASITIASGKNFSMADGTVGTATLNGTLSLAAANLGFDLGTAGADLLASSGAATVTGANIVTISIVGTTPKLGDSNLIAAPSGLSGGTYTFANGFTSQLVNASGSSYLLTLSNTDTVVKLNVTAGPIALTWTGKDSGSGSVNNLWKATSSPYNWATSNSPINYVDGSDVTFNDTNAVGGSVGTFAVSIDAAGVLPNSITFNNSTNGYTLSNAGASGIGGASGLTKTGNGALTLTGTHSYSGVTTISGGALFVNGALSTSATTVNATGFLRGSGDGITTGIVQGVTASGGTVWPGSAISVNALSADETLKAVGSVDLSAGGKLSIIMSNAAGKRQALTVGGNLTLAGTSVLSLAFDTPTTTPVSYTIVTTASSGISNAFNSVIGIISGAAGIDYDIIYTNGVIQTVNPGPGAVLNAMSNQIIITFKSTNVTPVKIADFKAETKGAGVNVSWTCVSEYQNAGFNLYRRSSEGVEWTLVNPALIAGRVTNPDEKMYSFFDWAPAGEWQYKLESVDLSGFAETYAQFAGPVMIEWNSDLSFAKDVDAVSVASVSDGFVVMAGVRNAQRVSATIAAMKQDTVAMSKVAVRELNDVATVSNIAVRSVASASAPSASSVSASNVGVRWFSSGKVSGSSFTAAKLTYSTPGVMIIPQKSMPNGYDLNSVTLQREGRNFSSLAKVPAGLLVYAPGYQDAYTDKDAVFIRKSAAATNVVSAPTSTGLFNSSAPVNVSSPATVSTDYHDVYFDFSTAYRPFTFTPWFSSKYLTQGTTQDFVINLPHASSGPAKLTLNLWSLTSSAADPDHALQLVINGQIVGDVSWDGGNKMVQLSFDVPTGVITAGDNTLSVVTPTLSGVSSQVCFMHSISADYTRTLDGSTSFEIVNNTGKSQLYELNNVPATGAWVVDARFSDRAALVASETQVQADGSLRLRFMASAGGTGKFVVTPMGQENLPISITAKLVKAAKITGTYLATGPLSFASGTQPLLTKRSKEGIRGTYFDQEQLFDYYNFGRFGPDGIRNAVRSLKPTYLLLVGRTTYDYRNYEGKNIDPLCPAYLVSTSFWAQTTSDSLFGDLGRGYPEVAVGRLPVNNTTELSGAIGHILGYNGIPQSGLRLHAVADQPDPLTADFGAQLDTMVKAYNPDVTWQENYLQRTYQTSPEVTEALKTAANGGADLILYSGHGNAARLGNNAPSILDQTTVQQWTGNTVFLQSTCTANWMAKNVDDYKSIAIQALTQSQGGISASIATSTYMNPDVATAFMNQLIKNTNKNNARWGNVLLSTQQWAGKQTTSGFYKDLMNTEQLFGDPAMPVFAPKTINTAPSNNSGAGTPVGTF